MNSYVQCSGTHTVSLGPLSRPFALNDLDDYEKHFTVMNYDPDVVLKQVEPRGTGEQVLGSRTDTVAQVAAHLLVVATCRSWVLSSASKQGLSGPHPVGTCAVQMLGPRGIREKTFQNEVSHSWPAACVGQEGTACAEARGQLWVLEGEKEKGLLGLLPQRPLCLAGQFTSVSGRQNIFPPAPPLPLPDR